MKEPVTRFALGMKEPVTGSRGPAALPGKTFASRPGVPREPDPLTCSYMVETLVT